MRPPPLLFVAAVLALAAGCSDGTNAAPPSQPQPSQAPPSQSAPATRPPNPELRLGQTHEVIQLTFQVKMTAFGYRQPLPSLVKPRRSGYEYAGAEIRGCDSADSREPGTFSWEHWALTLTDGSLVEPISAWSPEWFKVRLFPSEPRRVKRGGCVRGWAIFEVPRGQLPASVTYSPQGLAGPLEPVEWRIPKVTS